mmetsp:Transcript_45487/g.140564  ORF Transcript_45487/g.140564 Transcript_45487/m.140564 type:complete len:526 (-) Transcript_45487:1306-2883(-)
MPHKTTRPDTRSQAQGAFLRTEALRDLTQHLHLLLQWLVHPSDGMRGVRRDDDALALCGRGRQPLVQFLREVGQQRVHEPEGPVQASVEHLTRHLPVSSRLVARSLTIETRLQQFEVDVAKFVEEEAVCGRCGAGKFVLLESLVCLLGAGAEPREDPAVLPGEGRVHGQGAGEPEALTEVPETKARGVPHLVAEVSVAHDSVNVEVHVAALQGVGEKTEAQGVGAALRDTLREVLLLALLGLLDLLLGQVALVELLLEVREADALDHVQGVDDVAQALGHLPAVGVADHGVEVDRGEGELPREADGHHHHPGYPEEEDVVPCLQQRGGEEGLEVVVALGVGPAEDGEGEEAGGEPGVQHVLVLHDLHALDAQLRLGLLGRLLRGPAGEPELLLLLGLRDLVGRDAVAPPQLPRDAPLLDVLQPVEPGLVVELWKDLQLPLAQGLDALVGEFLAIHPPLGLQERLDDVLRLAAEAQAHRVRLLAHPKASLLQRLLDPLSSFETVLPRKGPAVLVDVAGLVKHVDLL